MGWINKLTDIFVIDMDKRRSICAKNLREDKIDAVLENKEFKYNAKRHNPRYGTTTDTGPR